MSWNRVGTTLPGRDEPAFEITGVNVVTGQPMKPPFPPGTETAVFALGCFWGAERLFWNVDGVLSTAVGYSGGSTPNPTYSEVCTGRTGHAEAVLVVFDPTRVGYDDLLKVFFEAHDPTQVDGQGNDIGTQYRSAIYWRGEDQKRRAVAGAEAYGRALRSAGFAPLATEVAEVGTFYYAEEMHQQYLHKVPGGYCGLRGTGVTCDVAR